MSWIIPEKGLVEGSLEVNKNLHPLLGFSLMVADADDDEGPETSKISSFGVEAPSRLGPSFSALSFNHFVSSPFSCERRPFSSIIKERERS